MSSLKTRLSLGVIAALLASGAALAQSVKIAYIDPLSGGGATIGEHGLKHLQFLVETLNAKGGVMGGQKLEAVAYDNKGSPQESLVQVQKAIDAGVRFITQGNGSGAAIAISEGGLKSEVQHLPRKVCTWTRGRSTASFSPRTG
jgi:branched-chain amino acid transport system substrate-binding protein